MLLKSSKISYITLIINIDIILRRQVVLAIFWYVTMYPTGKNMFDFTRLGYKNINHFEESINTVD